MLMTFFGTYLCELFVRVLNMLEATKILQGTS